jgi:2-aminoadipate transaminase
MRLSFALCDDESLREGIRRIGEVVTEQVQLYGTLTGAEPAPGRERPAPVSPEQPGARVLPLPSREERGRRAERR